MGGSYTSPPVPEQVCHGVTFTFTHVQFSNAKYVSSIWGYFHSITYHVSKNIKLSNTERILWKVCVKSAKTNYLKIYNNQSNLRVRGCITEC